MKRLFAVLLLLVSGAEAIAAEAPLANAGRKGLQAKTIDEMLALPDEEIDIGLGALLIGKEYDPDLDIPKYLAQLDQMARELRTRIGDEEEPRKVIAAVNNYIYSERRFRAVRKTGGLPGAVFLHALMDGRKGACLTLSALYLALGERVGLPVFGVTLPRHAFVRYVSPTGSIDIETTHRGTSLYGFLYKVLSRVRKTGADDELSMRSLSSREFLAVMTLALAPAYVKREEFDKAARLCQLALAVIPCYADGWTVLGAVLEAKGDSKGATDAYRKAVAIAPSSWKTWARIGYLCQKNKEFEEAVAAYRKVVQIKSWFTDGWYWLGTAYNSQGKLDDAIAAHRTALAIDRKNAAAWCALASALRQDGKLDQAAKAYEQAVEMDPGDPHVWVHLAFAYADQGKPERGIQTLRKALERHPTAWILWNNLSVELGKAGRNDEAIQALKRSLELGNPFSAFAVCRLVDLYVAQDRLDEAVAFLRESREKDPKLLWPVIGLGLAYERQGKREEARQIYEDLSKTRDDADKTWLELGWAYRRGGKLSEAIAAFERSLAANPESSEAWSALGSAHCELNEFDQAIEAFRKAATLDPKNWFTFYGLVLAYQAKGDHATAWKHAQRCMELGGKLDADLLKALREEMKKAEQ